MIEKILKEQFDVLLDAPESVPKLREMILQLAVMGKLVPQDPNDEPAGELLKRIGKEKERLIAEGKIKRPKELPPVGGDEKAFPLPKGWAWVRLGQVCSKVGSGSTPLGGREVYVSSGVPFLRSQNVWNDGIRLEGVAHISPKVHADMAGTKVEGNDLLFNITGASIGRCCIYPVGIPQANVSQHVSIVRLINHELVAYLHLVLISPLIFAATMDAQVGISREGLSIARLQTFVIALPPLAEQKRIVEKVDRLMAFCDELDARQKERESVQIAFSGAALTRLTEVQEPKQFTVNLNRVKSHFDLIVHRPEDVKKVRETILQLAVMGKLVPQDPNDEPAGELLKRIGKEKERLIAEGKIKRPKELPPVVEDEKPFPLPKGWEWGRFDTVAEVETNLIPPEGKYRTFPHIAPNHIEKDTGKLLDYGTVADDEVRSGKHLFQPGRILYSKIRPNLNKVVLVDFAGLCSADMYPVLSKIVREYLHRFMLSDVFLRQVVREDNRVAMPKVNQEQLSAVQVAIPPLAEQKRIVEKVDRLMAMCGELEAGLTKSREEGARLLEAVVAGVGK